MRPTVSVLSRSQFPALRRQLGDLGKIGAYVGIPATTAADRRASLTEAFQKIGGSGAKARRRKQKLLESAAQGVNNAELLFIHSKGSPLRGIPARPVLEPAIEASGNREAINAELTQAAQSMLRGDKPAAIRFMKRAGLAGRNAARRWFTDARNGWRPNSPATIRRKGSSQPLVDTGAMKAAITSLVKEE